MPSRSRSRTESMDKGFVPPPVKKSDVPLENWTGPLKRPTHMDVLERKDGTVDGKAFARAMTPGKHPPAQRPDNTRVDTTAAKARAVGGKKR